MDASPYVRPRLTPGIPRGGIAAIAVTLFAIGWGLATGTPDEPAALPDSAALAPLPPLPPLVPAAPLPPTSLIDIGAIAKSVKTAADLAAKAATARSDAMDGQSGKIRYLDRQTAADGSNRLAAVAPAPAGLRLADINGTVHIRVEEGAREVLFTLVNSRKRYTLEVEHGLLWVTGPGPDSAPPTELAFTVPKGTPLLVNNMTGDLVVEGDLAAPVRVELARGSLDLGHVTSARVRITQSGTVRLAAVDGLLAVQMPAAGSVAVGSAGQAFVDMAGSGQADIGVVREGLTVSLPGSGAAGIGRQDGPVALALPGTGRITIREGEASSFVAAVIGPGAVSHGGTAASPQLLLTGPGRISLAHHTGTPAIQRVGPGTLSLGDQTSAALP
ncbi:hypothetical protein [Oleisolibacter albus]|uniref:hypothetical protein n=1 Tax=Oleisolibacter albus TaxID=2171757 RepID=UPI000DF24B98|nr:hypothetical protein [Oleisolibacter albus]